MPDAILAWASALKCAGLSDAEIAYVLNDDVAAVSKVLSHVKAGDAMPDAWRANLLETAGEMHASARQKK